MKAHQASRRPRRRSTPPRCRAGRKTSRRRAVAVAPAVGKFDAERTDDRGVGLGEDGAAFTEEPGLLVVEPVEVNRSETFGVHGRNVGVRVARSPGRRDHQPGRIAAGALSASVMSDRRLLGLAHVLTVLPVGGGHVLGQGDDEPAVFVDLLRRRLALQEGDGVTQMLQPVLP